MQKQGSLMEGLTEEQKKKLGIIDQLLFEEKSNEEA